MPVVMKGGNSGCRHDYLPSISPGFDSQVPQNTANNSAGSNVQWCQTSGNGEPGQPGAQNPPVPSGGSPDDSAT